MAKQRVAVVTGGMGGLGETISTKMVCGSSNSPTGTINDWSPDATAEDRMVSKASRDASAAMGTTRTPAAAAAGRAVLNTRPGASPSARKSHVASDGECAVIVAAAA